MCVCVCSTPIPGLSSHWTFQSSESLVFPPMVEGEDSTVVGILQRSPASGERVGERVQSESVSEGQGTSYTISCIRYNAHINLCILCMLPSCSLTTIY